MLIVYMLLFVTVIWMKDTNELVDDGSRYQFTQSGQKFQLQIKNVLADDTSQYTLCAVDSAGKTVAAFSLNVFSNID